MNPRILISWFIMILYGGPILGLVAMDAYQGWWRTIHQPASTFVLLGIGLLIVGICILMIRSEKKEDRRYEALPRCKTCNLKLEPSIDRGGECVFCVAVAVTNSPWISGSDKEAVAAVAYVARRYYKHRPIHSRFGIAAPPAKLRIDLTKGGESESKATGN